MASLRLAPLACLLTLGGGSNLIVLGKDDFAGRLLNGTWFVEFFVDWCPHCRSLASRWEELADVAAEEGWSVNIARMDCTHVKQDCWKMHVRAYPSLALLREGVLQANFMGPPTLANWKDFVDAHDLSAGEGDPGDGAIVGGGGDLSPEPIDGGGWTPLLWPEDGGGPVVELSVGEPPQRLSCLLDTSVADVWVPSRVCEGCGAPGSFDPGASSSFTREDGSVKIAQRSLWISGHRAKDTVGLGPMEAANRSILVVEDAHLPEGRSWGGACGLAPRRSAGEGAIFEALDGSQSLVTLIPGAGNISFMALGSIPEGAARADTLSWTPVVKGSSGTVWAIKGGVAVTKAQPRPIEFVVDTRTEEVLLVPAVHYEPLANSLMPDQVFRTQCLIGKDDSRTIKCRCSVLEDKMLPPLRLSLGGRQFEMPIARLFLRPESQDGSEDMQCQLRIKLKAKAPVPEEMLETARRLRHGAKPIAKPGAKAGAKEFPKGEPWILGSGFLRHFVVVFDLENERFALGEPAAQPADASRLYEVDRRAGPGGAPPRGGSGSFSRLPDCSRSAVVGCTAVALFVACVGARLARIAWRQADPTRSAEPLREEDAACVE